jgi:hypothetical protein
MPENNQMLLAEINQKLFNLKEKEQFLVEKQKVIDEKINEAAAKRDLQALQALGDKLTQTVKEIQAIPSKMLDLEFDKQILERLGAGDAEAPDITPAKIETAFGRALQAFFGLDFAEKFENFMANSVLGQTLGAGIDLAKIPVRSAQEGLKMIFDNMISVFRTFAALGLLRILDRMIDGFDNLREKFGDTGTALLLLGGAVVAFIAKIAAQRAILNAISGGGTGPGRTPGGGAGGSGGGRGPSRLSRLGSAIGRGARGLGGRAAGLFALGATGFGLFGGGSASAAPTASAPGPRIETATGRPRDPVTGRFMPINRPPRPSFMGRALNAAGRGLSNVGALAGRAAMPLMLMTSGAQAASVLNNNELSTQQRTEDLSGIAGGVAGSLAGGQIGATTGALLGTALGPVGTVVGGALGGVVGGVGGYFGGEWVGRGVGGMLNDENSALNRVGNNMAEVLGVGSSRESLVERIREYRNLQASAPSTAEANMMPEFSGMTKEDYGVQIRRLEGELSSLGPVSSAATPSPHAPSVPLRPLSQTPSSTAVTELSEYLNLQEERRIVEAEIAAARSGGGAGINATAISNTNVNNVHQSTLTMRTRTPEFVPNALH